MPSLSFVATANAAHYLGAVPHFLDNEEVSLGIDASAAREWLTYNTERSHGQLRNKITGRRISAIVPMHTFGHPSDMNGLLALASDFQLVLVEDAAESLGSFYEGRHTGTMGRAGALSFNGNKIVTCCGGGALLTNDIALADYAKHLSTTAKRLHACVIDPGFCNHQASTVHGRSAARSHSAHRLKQPDLPRSRHGRQ